MTWGRRKTVGAVVAVVLAAALAVSLALVFGGSGAKPLAHRLVAAPAPKPTPKPKPKAKPKPKPCPTHVSPFTGEPVKELRPVLAAKIDNIVYARPQTGLTKADIVYVLPVEGGLTRFLAVWSSKIPPVIGPVRSARYDDLELLHEFGRPAFAYSGAQPELLPVVERAHIVSLYDGVVGGYFRSDTRLAPDNLYARTSVLLRESKGRESKARCIGFVFGPQPEGGLRARSVSVSYPAASFRFTWSAQRKHWLVWMDGSRAASTEGPQLSAATVIIQHTIVRYSNFLEEDKRPPYAESTGQGWALVLRGGRKYRVHWSRPTKDGGTTYSYHGKPFRFAKGQVWILFVGNPKAEAN
jgi:Protein of unknown function (DUF3048) N-terminal domain/Protein of unknown function (DUF3048) C-terminal domain